jgi:hypothetical protein
MIARCGGGVTDSVSAAPRLRRPRSVVAELRPAADHPPAQPPVVLAMLHAGARPGELRELRWRGTSLRRDPALHARRNRGAARFVAGGPSQDSERSPSSECRHHLAVHMCADTRSSGLCGPRGAEPAAAAISTARHDAAGAAQQTGDPVRMRCAGRRRDANSRLCITRSASETQMADFSHPLVRRPWRLAACALRASLPRPPVASWRSPVLRMRSSATASATDRRLVAFHVAEHNGRLPHAAFDGQTPDGVCTSATAATFPPRSPSSPPRRGGADRRSAAPHAPRSASDASDGGDRNSRDLTRRRARRPAGAPSRRGRSAQTVRTTAPRIAPPEADPPDGGPRAGSVTRTRRESTERRGR